MAHSLHILYKHSSVKQHNSASALFNGVYRTGKLANDSLDLNPVTHSVGLWGALQ